MYTRAIRTGTFNGDYAGINDSDCESVCERLEILIATNTELARGEGFARVSPDDLMRNPISFEKSVGQLGLMLGALPPLAILARFLFDATIEPGMLLFISLFVAATAATAAAGYFSAKIVSRAIAKADGSSISTKILLFVAIGFVWGGASGAAGGLFLFVIGSIFGFVIGALTGTLFLPVFIGLFRTVSSGGFIERRHFLPICFGVTLSICAFILGL